jgi:DNA-binding CsgD family transcriptional regulator
MPQIETMAGRRDALVIAIGTYVDPQLRRLRAPAQDADGLARVLAEPNIGGFQVRKLLDLPHYEIMLGAEQFFANRSREDLLLIHVSAHGIKDDDGRLFFAASNTQKQWLGSTAVAAAWFNELMDRCRARSIVLLLDCCYSGAFMPGSKSDEGVHLKEKFEGRGRAILTASNAIEYAWEGEELSGSGRPSVFTQAIVEGLATGDADRDGDGIISIDELYDYTYERVQRKKQAQTPQKWTLGIERNLYVARSYRRIGSSTTVSALPPDLEGILSHSIPGVRIAAVEELAELIRADNPNVAQAARHALGTLINDSNERVAQMAGLVLEGNFRPSEQRDVLTGPRYSDVGARPRLAISDREIEWLRTLAAGSTVARLAEGVGYSERAMFRLLRDLYQRLGVKSRTEALMLAQQQGWL